MIKQRSSAVVVAGTVFVSLYSRRVCKEHHHKRKGGWDGRNVISSRGHRVIYKGMSERMG